MGGYIQGSCTQRITINLLRNAKKYARQASDPGDRVKIEEHWEDEQSTLYEYEVEDWR